MVFYEFVIRSLRISHKDGFYLFLDIFVASKNTINDKVAVANKVSRMLKVTLDRRIYNNTIRLLLNMTVSVIFYLDCHNPKSPRTITTLNRIHFASQL